MSTFVTLWWLGFWTAAGLCVGSFLNVVIYRIPRSKTLSSPLWSACPYCDSRIRWHDNLPVVSFLRLGGRCRDCHRPIATRYMVVELSMAMIVLLLIGAFFIGQLRSGIGRSDFGLTDQFSLDWPIFIAHLILFACLFSMSAIDLEHYWVDVRFTNFAALAGFVLHALWTPRHSQDWTRPGDLTAILSFLAMAGVGLTWVFLVCQPNIDPEDFGEAPPRPAEGEDTAFTAGPMVPPTKPPSRLSAWVSLLLFAALFAGLAIAGISGRASLLVPLLLAVMAFFFLLIMRESWQVREADREIEQAIEEERSTARRVASVEFLLLLPAMVFVVAGFLLWTSSGETAEQLSGLLHASARVPGVSMMQRWEPFHGLGTAAAGFVVAGALGWAVRIFFTLLFGKEAFGAGDIHLMAAAGAVAGWPVAVLGFFLACGLAIVGWVLSLPRKRTRAIPLGPWLSLGFLIVALFYDSIVRWPFVARVIDAFRLLSSPELQF